MPPSNSYKWWVVGMLWLVCLFNYADRQAIFSVFVVFKQPVEIGGMGLTNVQCGVVGSAFMWVYALTLPFAGMVGDRVSRKTLILGGLAFWSAITVATGFAQTYWQLVLFRALEGFGEAFYFPASMSMISDYHGKATRSRAMAIHQSSVYVGTVVGGTVAGFCAQYYGWRSGFFLFGGAGILLAAVLVFTLKEPVRGAADAADPHARPPTPGDLVRGVGEVLGNPMVRVLLAVFVGTVFVGSIFLAWMPTYLAERFGMSLSMAGLNATLWLQAASITGVLVGGWLADRWALRHLGGRMRVQAIGLLVGAPLVFIAGWTTAVPVLVLALIGFGFCKGLYDSNTWAALYDVVRPERRGTALGLVNGLGWLLGGAPAPIIIAMSADRFGFGPSISGTAAIYLLTGLLLLAGVRLYLAPRRAKPLQPKEDLP
jgi:MFS family permease